MFRTEMEIIICGDGSFDFPQDCPVGNAHLRTDLWTDKTIMKTLIRVDGSFDRQNTSWPPATSYTQKTWAGKYILQNDKYKMTNTKYKTQSNKYKVTNTKNKMTNTSYGWTRHILTTWHQLSEVLGRELNRPGSLSIYQVSLTLCVRGQKINWDKMNNS